MNIYFGKQTVKLKKNFTKVSIVGLFSILACNIAQFTQLLNFWLSFRLVLLRKWNNNFAETIIQCTELLRKTAKICQLMTKKVL